MMKKLLSVSIAALFLFTATDSYADKMDLMLKTFVAKPAIGKAFLSKSMSIRNGVEQIDVLIKSNDTVLTRIAIEEAGGTVRSIIGSIMTAYVPTSYLSELDSLHEVVAIEASKPMRSLMDTARSNTGVITLQGGYEGITYTGNDVVVGVIDTGIDYSRSDFDDTDGNTRVQYMRFQSVSGNSVTITECAQDAIADGSCSIPASNDSLIGHGTHVSGIAASSDGTYTGVAPAADIMLVRNDFSDDINEGTGTFTGGLLDGVVEIFEKSDILDKAAVINISQGTHIGAHDNTSLLEQGINEAVTGGYADNGKSYGRSVVAAAGNEYIVGALLGDYSEDAGGIHVAFSLANGEATGYRLWVLAESAPNRTPLLMDAWFGEGQGSGCKIAGNVYDYGTIKDGGTATTQAVAAVADMPLNADDSASSTSADEKVTVIVATDSEDAQNGKPRGLVGFQPGAEGTWADIETDLESTGYVLDVIIRATGGSCAGNMWIEGGGTYVNFMKGIDTAAYDMTAGDNGAAYTMGAGDNNMSVGLPATATGVVAVGSFLQEKPFDGQGLSQWTDSGGTTYDATDIDEPAAAQINGGTVGQRSPFSSIGPTADGRVKPEILAPGDPIISTLASGYNPADALKVNSSHWKNQGTSQASPHVAGFVALLFEKNNTLTQAEVREAIVNTGTAAMIVGKADNEQGYGNLQAPNAVASVTADASGYNGVDNLTTADLDGGGSSSSSGGCMGTITPVSASNGMLLTAMLLMPVAVIFRRRKRRS